MVNTPGFGAFTQAGHLSAGPWGSVVTTGAKLLWVLSTIRLCCWLIQYSCNWLIWSLCNDVCNYVMDILILCDATSRLCPTAFVFLLPQ